MTLGSRKELDCLVQFINDEFNEPAFEVKKTMLNDDDVKIQIMVSKIIIFIIDPHQKYTLLSGPISDLLSGKFFQPIRICLSLKFLPEVHLGSEGEFDEESGSVLLGRHSTFHTRF